MPLFRDIKRRVRACVVPCVFLGVAGYFVWNAVQGDRGLLMATERREELRTKQAELAELEAERAVWERRVMALRGERIDRDMLDERARAMLNLAEPDDVIVQFSPKDRMF